MILLYIRITTRFAAKGRWPTMSYQFTLIIHCILAVKRAIKIILYDLPEFIASSFNYFQVFAILDFLGRCESIRYKVSKHERKYYQQRTYITAVEQCSVLFFLLVGTSKIFVQTRIYLYSTAQLGFFLLPIRTCRRKSALPKWKEACNVYRAVYTF